MSNEPFSAINPLRGGQYTAPQIRAYIRELKTYLAQYPQQPAMAEAFAEEIRAWENVLSASKYVAPFKIKPIVNE